MSLRDKLERVGDEVGEMLDYAWKIHNPFEFLVASVKLPGLLVLQYAFFWNWKRIIDADGWQVVVTGLVVWAVGIASIGLLLVYN